MAKLSDKIAVVTGGTGELGRVVIEQMNESGAGIITTHTGSESSLTYVSGLQKKGLMIDGYVVDVTSKNSVDHFYDAVLSKYGRIDILCNLVGGVDQKKFIEDISLEEWNAMFALNLQSCFLMMGESLRQMKKNGFGRIINIASKPGVMPEAKRGGYGVSKAAVIALTKAVAEEVKEFENITINAIAPSVILTQANRSWGTKEDQAKWVTLDQIAEMIMYLCSDSGSSINGQIIQMYGKV